MSRRVIRRLAVFEDCRRTSKATNFRYQRRIVSGVTIADTDYADVQGAVENGLTEGLCTADRLKHPQDHRPNTLPRGDDHSHGHGAARIVKGAEGQDPDALGACGTERSRGWRGSPVTGLEVDLEGQVVHVQRGLYRDHL
jgi:hypothetical protein